ncbi:hypothetical protein GCM10010222_20890 [Streptomyces tanashiensis]|nr:hypothetical protein GCM10010222_20890 [Streptomyces tanashiensis]
MDGTVPATGSRSPGSSAAGAPAGSRTGRTASRSTPPGASGTAPWPRSVWKEGFQWVASDAAKPCSVTVRGAPSRTRCTGGSPSHASPVAVAGATGAASRAGAPAPASAAFRPRHFSNIPTVSNLLSQKCC